MRFRFAIIIRQKFLSRFETPVLDTWIAFQLIKIGSNYCDPTSECINGNCCMEESEQSWIFFLTYPSKMRKFQAGWHFSLTLQCFSLLNLMTQVDFLGQANKHSSCIPKCSYQIYKKYCRLQCGSLMNYELWTTCQHILDQVRSHCDLRNTRQWLCSKWSVEVLPRTVSSCKPQSLLLHVVVMMESLKSGYTSSVFYTFILKSFLKYYQI